MQALRNFIQSVEKARLSINKLTGKQVQSKPIRAELSKLVDSYFRDVRPALGEDLSALDSNMQDLLRLTHGNSSVAKYKRVLLSARKALQAIETQSITLPATSAAKQPNESDAQIVATLKRICPEAAASYQQALTDLASTDRASWRGPATDLREALRETLDRLATDDAVASSPGFKLESNTTGPTMKQKVRHILRSRDAGKTQVESIESAVQSVDGIIGAFVRSVYNRSSVSTHVTSSREEVLRIKALVSVALSEILAIRLG
jgi:hypothetical protein